MEKQKKLIKMRHYGGTMRLGAYDCEVQTGTISHRAYKSWRNPVRGQGGLAQTQKKQTSNGGNSAKGPYVISERHRHRYEVNNYYRKILEEKGMVVAGVNPKANLIEIIEIKNHPFFVATQFHPEFKSRPLRPHPLFKEFIRTAIKISK